MPPSCIAPVVHPMSGSERAPRAGPSTQGPSPRTPCPMRGPGDYTTSRRRRVKDSTWHVRPACLLVGTCVRNGLCLRRTRREDAREKIEVAGAAGRRRALGRGGACVPAGAGSPPAASGSCRGPGPWSCMHGVTGARPASWRPPGERPRGGGSILGAHLAPGAWSSPPELPWRAPRRGRYGTQRSLPGDPLRHSAVLLARPVSEGLKCDAPGPSLGEADPEFDGVKRLSTRGKEKPRQVSELGKDLGDAHTPSVAGSRLPCWSPSASRREVSLSCLRPRVPWGGTQRHSPRGRRGPPGAGACRCLSAVLSA